MILLMLWACGPNTDPQITDSADDAKDERITLEQLGTLTENQEVWEGPDFYVEPGQEIQMCVFGTYTGPDTGLHDVHTWQGAGGHHLQLMGTTTPIIDVPDGTVVDCTDEGGSFEMADLRPVGVTNGGTVGNYEIEVSMPLPEGMAVELESGQRFVMQSHYLNPSADRLHVRDVAVLTLTPAEEVSTWAAPLIFNDSSFSIPPGQDLTSSFDCTTDEDWNFLYVLGHMHEWGTAFLMERQEGEDWSGFYEEPVWDAVLRDAPRVDYYPDGAMTVPAGTTFRTTCSWYNDEDTELVFPHEMCVGLSIVYPQKTTVVCDGG